MLRNKVRLENEEEKEEGALAPESRSLVLRNTGCTNASFKMVRLFSCLFYFVLTKHPTFLFACVHEELYT